MIKFYLIFHKISLSFTHDFVKIFVNFLPNVPKILSKLAYSFPEIYNVFSTFHKNVFNDNFQII